MAKLYTYGFIYRIYDFIRNFVNYKKTKSNVSSALYSDEFRGLIKRYLNTDLDKDWLGRLYGVINPNVNIEGNFDVSNVIIEIDGEYTNTDEYVKTWIFRQLNVMGQLFKLKGLYSNVTMDIEHVGPITQDNYLIVFDINGREEMSTSFKKLMKTVLAYAGIGISVLGMLMLTNII